jgi:hypothetical protein
MSTTRTFTRDDVSFQILMGSLVGHVTDPDGPLVLAVLDGECIGVASVDVHDALKADTGASSDEELSRSSTPRTRASSSCTWRRTPTRRRGTTRTRTGESG